MVSAGFELMIVARLANTPLNRTFAEYRSGAKHHCRAAGNQARGDTERELCGFAGRRTEPVEELRIAVADGSSGRSEERSLRGAT